MFTKLFLLCALTAWGGWATITVEDLPTQLVAGRPVTLTFMVRQHGITPLNGLDPTLQAVAANGGGGGVVTAHATAATGSGRYRVTFTVPTPGAWSVTINSGFGASRVTLEPLTAIAPVRAATPEPEGGLAERGRRLFVAKGCGTCHLYRGVSDASLKIGPELTEPRLSAAYLARLLADPATVLAERPRTTTATMPNLELHADEIAALSAFLAGPGAR